MFDRTVIEGARYPSKIEVTHTKPSTADDLRLLKEMRAEIIAEFCRDNAEDNTLVRSSCYQNRVTQETIVCLKLNGRDISVCVSNQALAYDRYKTACEVLARAIAEQLTIEVAMSSVSKGSA
jgi:hypothetical protein